MKVAFLVWRFPVLSEAFILNQITGLIDQGHEVYIYALNGRPQGTTKVHPVVERYQLLQQTHYCPERPRSLLLRVLKGLWLLLTHLHLGSWRCLQLLNADRYGKTSEPWKRIYRGVTFLDRPVYDIVHCQFGTLGPTALMLKQAGLLQGKLVTTFRGIDISRHVQEQGEAVYQNLFAAGDFFLANCDFFRQRAIHLGCPPQSIVVHGSGIDCQTFAFQPRHYPTDQPLRIATIGRLVEKKGIEYAIRAVAQVLPIYPAVEFNIIGDGPLKADLQALIEDLSVGDSVHLLGWRQQQEIIQILATCQLFVAPSVTAADGNQDAPVNTLKEAMAMGLPVISTYHGGIPELVQDGISGFLVPERDAEAIADKLLYLISHPEQWPDMGQAGRTYVEAHYDMRTLNTELVELYQRLLKEKSTDSQANSLDLAILLSNP